MTSRDTAAGSAPDSGSGTGSGTGSGSSPGRTGPLDGQDRRRRFEALAGRVWEPLSRYLARRTDPDTAQDVLADVLLVLWRRLEEVPEDAALPWTYGVARRCLANARRAEQRRARLAVRVASEPASTGGPAAASPAADAHTGADEELQAALARLSDRDREVLRLWAWEELTAREIGTVLGTTTALASVRLSRAKSRLRRACKTTGPAGQEQGRQGEEAR